MSLESDRDAILAAKDVVLDTQSEPIPGTPYSRPTVITYSSASLGKKHVRSYSYASLATSPDWGACVGILEDVRSL